MVVEVVFALVWVICGGVGIVGTLLPLRRFLRETSRIEDEMCLARFKTLARKQMYLALLMIALAPLVFVLSALLVLKYGMPGGAVVFAVSVAFIALGRYIKTFEKRARNLEAASEPLEAEYRRVCNSWTRKALPDF